MACDGLTACERLAGQAVDRLIQATIGADTFTLKTEQLLTPWRLALLVEGSGNTARTDR
jgi:hypothetical protein